MVSKTIDDLPDPDTPVKRVILRFGMRNDTFFRLFSRAPRIVIYSWDTIHSLFCDPLDSRLLSRLRRPVGRFNTELPGVLGVEPLPAELHRLATNDAADGSSAEQVIQHIETHVPSGSTHRDEAATDGGPQRQARAETGGFEFPPHIETTPAVLKQRCRVGSRHSCFGNLRRGRSYRGELHCGSDRTQVPIGVEGRPLAQMRRVGKRLPDFFRRVAQFSDENERPLFSVLSYLRPAGRPRFVLFAVDHLLLLFSVGATGAIRLNLRPTSASAV